jgi:cupin fold WbuC family metalloprotein
MLITQQLLDELASKAKASPRLRTAYDLRTTPDDNSQRILNAVEPGTILPIHRHRTTTETIVVLRGRVRQNYYDDKGNVTDSFELAPISSIVGMSVPVGQWHALESLESGSIILETKDGAYAPLTDEDILKTNII